MCLFKLNYTFDIESLVTMYCVKHLKFAKFILAFSTEVHARIVEDVSAILDRNEIMRGHLHDANDFKVYQIHVAMVAMSTHVILEHKLYV